MPWMPILASEHGETIDLVMVLIHLVMLAALIAWSVFFVVPLVRFRKGKNPKADHEGLKTRFPYVMVALMAFGEAVVFLGVSLPFWERHVIAGAERVVDPFEVRVIGQQFQWNIHYPGKDGIFGRTLPSLVDDVENPIGLDGDDPAGEDDITTRNMLYIPVGVPILAHITSKDVIHSFGLVEFRVKQDAIPGMQVPVIFTATMTTEELRERTGNPKRNFEIVCAQLCGLGHYRMRGFVNVITPEAYALWYDKKLEIKLEYDDW